MSNKTHDNSQFTTDQALAALLLYLGYELVGCKVVSLGSESRLLPQWEFVIPTTDWEELKNTWAISPVECRAYAAALSRVHRKGSAALRNERQ
jgi:hypothetical protein